MEDPGVSRSGCGDGEEVEELVRGKNKSTTKCYHIDEVASLHFR